MASHVTHLMVADGVLVLLPHLRSKEFCVGNIAPDCNIENEDFTAFIPPREVTHMMSTGEKREEDCEAFFERYLEGEELQSARGSFLLGYYSHLLTDAAFTRFMRSKERIQRMWARIEKRFPDTMLPHTWENAKKLIPKAERMAEIHAIEARYLTSHPRSGYLTEILPLKHFPDYIDLLPPNAIVPKIRRVGYLPKDTLTKEPIGVTEEEYLCFVHETAEHIAGKIQEKYLS